MNDHDESPINESAADEPATSSATDAIAEPTPASGYAGPGWPATPPSAPAHPTAGAWHPYPDPSPASPLGADPWAGAAQPPGPGVPPPAPWAATVPPPQFPPPPFSTPPPYNPVPPAGDWHRAWSRGEAGPEGPFGGGGAGVPPTGGGAGWMYPGPGEPWPNLAPHPPSRRRRARTAAAAAAVTAGVLGAAAAGVFIGHAAWTGGASTQSAASSLPVGSSSGSSGGSASSGSSGSSGSTGSAGSGSSGLNPFGSGSDPFGSLGSSASGGSSTATGAPANAAAIAKKVDAGLVDINTTLGYQGEEAAGTGMVLTSGGEILTNNHVIDGATSIRVTDIGNGKTYSATVVGYDRTQDVAVLQLAKASGLSTVTLASSSNVTKGEAVVGIGNAGGAGGTPSYAGGSVTALGQSITASDQGGGNPEQLVGLIETNANIQPGDSGGSLVNTNGQVIGMDTAASASTQFQAATSETSYAIPISEAVGIAQQIVAGHSTSVIHIGTTALLGVEIESATSGSSTFGGGASGSTTSGAVIAGVVSGTPAANAGLVDGDTITGVNGQSITSAPALTNALSQDKPGQTVQITYTDPNGATHTASVHLTAGPPQ